MINCNVQSFQIVMLAIGHVVLQVTWFSFIYRCCSKELTGIFLDFQLSFLPTVWPKSDVSIRDQCVEYKCN